VDHRQRKAIAGKFGFVSSTKVKVSVTFPVSRLTGQVTADASGLVARRWDRFRVGDNPGVRHGLPDVKIRQQRKVIEFWKKNLTQASESQSSAHSPNLSPTMGRPLFDDSRRTTH
jgi:hypothetical protein